MKYKVNYTALVAVEREVIIDADDIPDAITGFYDNLELNDIKAITISSELDEVEVQSVKEIEE